MKSLKKTELATFSFTWWVNRTRIHGALGAGWRILSTWLESTALVLALQITSTESCKEQVVFPALMDSKKRTSSTYGAHRSSSSGAGETGLRTSQAGAPYEKHHRITESQNGRGWKGPLRVI